MKCHSVPVSRNWFPVVAASVGVASIGASASVALLYLIACNVWMPVVSGTPKQTALNFTGILQDHSLSQINGDTARQRTSVAEKTPDLDGKC